MQVNIPLNTVIQGEVVGYLASLLDCEGSIMIRKQTYRMRSSKYKDCVNPYYTARIGIKMTMPAPLELMKKTFGGCLFRDKRTWNSRTGYTQRKVLHIYCAEHALARRILESLLPFLLVKRKQALLALALYDIKKQYTGFAVKGRIGRLPNPKEMIDRLEANYQAVKLLNR